MWLRFLYTTDILWCFESFKHLFYFCTEFVFSKVEFVFYIELVFLKDDFIFCTEFVFWKDKFYFYLKTFYTKLVFSKDEFTFYTLNSSFQKTSSIWNSKVL